MFFEAIKMLSAVLISALLLGSSEAASTNKGTCKANFLNTVFNTGIGKHASFPDPIWSTLKSYGISNFSTLITLFLGQVTSNLGSCLLS